MRVITILLLAFAAAFARPAAAADLPPVESFFAWPRIWDAQLSPSGKWLAVIAPAGTGRLALAVVDSEGKQAPTVAASFSNVDILDFDWVGDDRLVFTASDLGLTPGDEAFVQRRARGLYSVRRDGSEQRELIESTFDMGREMRTAGRRPLSARHSLLAVPRSRDGEWVIVGEGVFDRAGDLEAVDIKRLNAADGRVESLLLDRPARATGWLFDPRGEPRVAVSQTDGVERVYWRGRDASGWKEIASFPSLRPAFQPLSVDSDGNFYVTVEEGTARTQVLTRFDFATGKPSPDVMARAAGFDVDPSLLYSVTDRESRLIGMRLLTDAETSVWFEPAMKRVQAAADARFPGRINRVTCRSSCISPEVVLVRSWSDQDPGSIWVYRPAADDWRLVGRTRPDVDPAAMARLDLHRIKTRDGREIPIWVTVPKGAKPGAPAVVLVHGGPHTRGASWRWDAEAQFLASRGYVVVEPEFRGSTGYGGAHFEAGWKHWGDTMQDDNEDALRWAVDRGLVDPKRVCIAGASYGGYATLMSLVRHPQTYRCGIAWAAVTDPTLMFDSSWENDLPAEWQKHGLRELLGDPLKDAEMLRRSTPAVRADEIKVPVLLAFGRDDRRVPLEHGNRMRAALTKAGRPPEWIVYEGEGHGWRKRENAYDFYRRVESFLATQLK